MRFTEALLPAGKAVCSDTGFDNDKKNIRSFR